MDVLEKSEESSIFYTDVSMHIANVKIVLQKVQLFLQFFIYGLEDANKRIMINLFKIVNFKKFCLTVGPGTVFLE